MSAHSDLPPSGASAWRRCALWVTMNKRFPKEDTPETLEGNAAHWVAWEILAGRPVAVGQITPNGQTVTDEMLDGGELLVDTVRERMPGAPLYVEQPICISRIHPQCWGTPDVWAYLQAAAVLEVVDYKFGNRFVDEYENDQGVAYVAGIIDHIAATTGTPAGILDQHLRVNFTVVQPRCYYRGKPVRTWSVMASDLRAHINRLSTAAHTALTPDPTATTNEECRDCPGRHACPALQQAAYADAEYASKSTPVELTSGAASLELRMLERALDRLQSRVEGLKEQVSVYARQGKVTPFHRVEQGYGRQQWTVPPEQVVALGSLYGKDFGKPGCLTPKQVAKLGVDDAVIKAYSVTPMGSLKLIPVNPADARRVFGKTM